MKSNMTQEDKQLLYKDLSARQPYRPFVCFAGKVTMPFLDVIASTEGNEPMSINGLSFEEVKPYLRPMSSLIEKELDECRATCKYRQVGQSILDCATPETIDYLISHHFDYRGLIEKGLALEAPDGMYKF